MIQKKICLVGASAVGKTSLVERYVSGIFSDRYLTTVGVVVKKKTLSVDGHDVTLMVWDLAGEDAFQTVRPSHLRGAAGYLLVADGTRRSTFETALLLHDKVVAAVGTVPFVLLINKADLVERWEIDEGSMADVTRQGWTVIKTSAKTGDGVEDAFLMLTRGMMTS